MSETTTDTATQPRQHDDPALNDLVWIRHPALAHKPAQRVTRAKAQIKAGSGYEIVDDPDGEAAGERQAQIEPAPANTPPARTPASRRAAADTEEQS